jgi:hypothetical protein
MGSPIVTNLQNMFRYLPQRSLEGALGKNIGQRVEGWLGMSPEPMYSETGQDVYQAPGSPSLTPQWEEANRQSQQQHLSAMKKPLPKGK